ncbi:MAG: LPXTG cell wall anchor domain-containing protein [Coriobacteriia bacterium]
MFRRAQFSSLLIVSLVVAILAAPALAIAAPGLHLTISVSPTTISVAGPVTYTYVLTYGGPSTEVTSVVLTDRFGVVPGPSSGDTGTASVLTSSTEAWVYSRTTTITATTTNVATATAGQMYENTPSTISTSTFATVTYSPTTTSTVDGGHIPHTGSPWYGMLVLGLALTLAGTAGVAVVSRRRHA